MTKGFINGVMLCLLVGGSTLLSSCGTFRSGRTLYAEDIPPKAVVRDGVAVTLSDQKLTVFKEGKKVKDYSISSSKFGIGNTNGSNRTPLGIHAISQKNGEGQPQGMVFKGCKPTGEVVDVDAEGRDPVVYKGQIDDLKILRDGFIIEVFVNGGEEVYTALL